MTLEHGLTSFDAGILGEIHDEAIHTCLECARSRPTPGSKFAMVHLDGVTPRVPVEVTAYSHQDAEVLLNDVARCDDSALDDESIVWTRDRDDALSGYSTGWTDVNLISEDMGQVRIAYHENQDRPVGEKAEYDPEELFQLNQNVEPAASPVRCPS